MTNFTERCVCVFAHPDDEAFGPSGTIAALAERGEVYLICVTNGKDRTNKFKNLAKIREKELRKSSKLLGVKKVFYLNYEDGELSNNKYHKVAKEIELILEKIKPDTLVTFEMRGVSGHIDHIFCSMVTSYLFRKLSYVKRVMYFALLKEVSDKMEDYFIYFPQGFGEKEVDEVIDVSKFWDKKVAAIKAHKYQLKDGERVLSMLSNLPKKRIIFCPKKVNFIPKLSGLSTSCLFVS